MMIKNGIISYGRRLAVLISLTSGLVCAAAAAPAAGDSPAQSNTPPAAGDADAVGKSVVKVLATLRYPDRIQPWNKKPPVSSAASGVVIEGKRILTVAHAVAYASDVQIVGNDGGDKFNATVEAISPEADLAVLKLEDDSFFGAHPPLARAGKLPELKEPVAAYGFPVEGTNLWSGKGQVSRIDFTSVSGAGTVQAQVDAPIDPSASGGPTVADNRIIGLSFSPPGKAASISYVIPCEDIDLFLKGIRAGGYHGRPVLNIVVQDLRQPVLRSFLGADKSVHGVVVQQGVPAPANGPLRKWDIITQVGHNDLDDDGAIHLENGLRLGFPYLFGQLAVNGMVPMTVIRSGQTMHLDVPVQSAPNRLLPDLNGAYPDYFIYGPLAFTDASKDLFYEMVNGIAGGSAGVNGILRLLGQDTPLVTRCDDSPKFAGERLVMVTGFFHHKLSENYPNPVTQVVKAVNGVPIKNLAHLVEVLRDCKEKFVSIEFFGRYSDTLAFPREEMVADTESILSDNNVHNQGSADMLAVWNAKKQE
jgi:S1-C subfamily serine protease